MATPVNVTRQANPGPLYAGRFPPAPPVAAPVAEFIGSPTSGTAPFTVTFTDQSTGSISSWAWDFGDGSSSSSQNPTHNFTAAGSYTVALTATGPGGSNTRTRMAYVSAAAPTVPTTATLSGSESASVGSPHTSRVTLDQPADQTYTITWTRSDSGTGSATSTITAGNTYAEATDTWAAIGTGRTVDFTISPTLTRAGNPLTVNVADFAWAFADAATQTRGRNMTTVQATGVPAGAVCTVSPDLLPGETLQLSGSTLQIVGDSKVPTVDGSSSGSAIDIISARDLAIEVIEDPAIATIVNVTQSITYAPAADYTGRCGSQAVNRWNAVMNEAAVNDIIEVSPGAIQRAGTTDTANYWSNNLDSSILAIWKPITLRGMTGRGRWWLYSDRSFASSSPNGITIYAPAEIDAGRGAFTISDFDIDEWGNTSGSYGLRIRANIGAAAWTDYHSSLTVSNFKLGKPPYERSASGFEGSAETMTFENGHVYDCGFGVGGSDGRDHNFYVSARTLTMRGVRAERTRGINAAGWWEPGGADTDMDGHIAKLSFIDALIEGCAFICGPRGDNSLNVQCKAGGNLVMRGCLLIGGRYTQNQGQGMVVMLREATGGVPNYSTWWDAYRTGNSVLLERNVFVNHYGKPLLFFFTTDLTDIGAMLSGSGADQIATVTVRDNIAMVNNAVNSDAPFTSAKWIKNDPTGGGTWTARGNAERDYSAGAFAFEDRELLIYRDVAGAPAAGTGSMTVKQFLWPHHWRDVTRSTQGLG